MYRYKKYLITSASLFIFLTCFGKGVNKPDSTWNDWNYRVGAYFWFVGMKGEIIRPPAPSLLPILPEKKEIDIKFKDIQNNIKFAAMLTGAYKTDNFIAQFNFTSLVLESEALTPLELILQDNIINLTFISGDLGVGYRIIKRPKFELDGLIGTKYIYFKVGASSKVLGKIEISGEREKFWFDPVLGANILYRPHPRIEIAGFGDFGPYIWDDFTFQYFTYVNFIINKNIFTTLGYRYYYANFPKENAIYNGSFRGAFIRVGAQF